MASASDSATPGLVNLLLEIGRAISGYAPAAARHGSVGDGATSRKHWFKLKHLSPSQPECRHQPDSVTRSLSSTVAA